MCAVLSYKFINVYVSSLRLVSFVILYMQQKESLLFVYMCLNIVSYK